MALVECDDPELSRHLSRMQELILDNSGYIHDQLKIVAQDSMLSIETSTKHEENKPIIIIPSNLLLALDDYNLAIDDDHIVIESYKPGIAAQNIELMQLMLNIYNHTNKLSLQRKTDPALTYLSDEGFYTKITSRRDTIYLDLVKNELSAENILLNNYLKTRALDFKPTDDVTSKVLMPIVDCLNNHPKSPPCSGMENENGQRSLVIFQSSPLNDSNECFIRYGVLDAIELFLSYQYAEENAFFARSIELDLELPDIGQIRINSSTELANINSIPNDLKDLYLYLPKINIDISKNCVEAAFLMIPQRQAPLSMRRILSYMIRMLRPDIEINIVTRHIMHAERIIIQENIRHYTELMKYLDKYGSSNSLRLVHDMAKRAVKNHLENIYKYPYLSNNKVA